MLTKNLYKTNQNSKLIFIIASKWTIKKKLLLLVVYYYCKKILLYQILILLFIILIENLSKQE